MGSKLFYKGTDIEVKLGDIIEYRKFFGFGPARSGFVSYMPGESKPHRELEYGDVSQWGLNIGGGNLIVIAYVPDELQPPRGLKFISRGNPEEETLKPDDEVL